MKTILTAALTPLLFAGSAFAADGVGANGFRIESEAQFVRDYGDQIEHVGPGVYQIVKGKLAGKTVSIGEAGLRYDLSERRARVATAAKSGKAKIASDAILRRLEGVQARYEELRAASTGDVGTRQAGSGSFPCIYSSPFSRSLVWYYGYANIGATTELYLDRGDGTFNWYYARAAASAYGWVNPPFNVPASVSMVADAQVENLYTGEFVSYTVPGIWSTGISTGYIYSGPVFYHNLRAFAAVSGVGNCFGYVSISDSMTPPVF
ncbi:MAG: hypothetical protein ABL934_12730 [Lysobacteraceae bacterium]